MLKFLLSRIPEDKRRPSILLIDDDRDIRTVTGMVLATRGIGTVHEAGSGQDGLRMAREQRPDAILLDVGLPDMSGEIVLQVLKADPWTRQIPVVLFTAYANERRRLQTLPVADVVLKPFHPDALVETLARALQSSMGAQESATPRMGPRSVPGGGIASVSTAAL